MSLPRSGWPTWAVPPDGLLRYDRPWTNLLWPLVRLLWWDRGWGFGNPPWWTKDDINAAEDRAAVLYEKLEKIFDTSGEGM